MISPFSSKISNPESSHLPILIANRGRHSPPSSPDSPDLTLQHAAVRQLARVQAVASLISIIAIVSLVYIGYFIDLRLELPRLLALLATAVLTERAFSDAANRHFSPKYNRNQTNLRRLSIVLQTVWIISELAFSSAFAPLLLAVAPSLALSFSGSLTLCILPLAAMVTLTGCLEFFSKIRHRGKRHRRLSSVNSEDFEQLTPAANNNNNSSSTRTVATSNSGKYPSQAIHMPSDIYVSTTTPPLSPADSFLSGSSGGLASGLPSPTGHCPSPDRAAMIRYMQEHGNNNEGMPPSSKDVYLMEHVGSYKDSDESMLFVHKILKPIKTSMNDQHMPAPNADYKPLLQQLMAQSQKQSQGPQNSGTTTANGIAVMQPCPPLFQPAVVATITVVKGKGNNTLVNTNQPQIPIPVIS